VPLYILGSSLFGAQLAAALGLPYGFASHFAPAALEQAVAVYRSRFRPSKQLEKPYVIAGVNVLAADDRATAEAHFRRVRIGRTKALLGRGKNWSDEMAEAVLQSPAGRGLEEMARYSAVGTGPEVKAYLEDFAKRAQADELMTVHAAPSVEARVRSLEVLAQAWGVQP
jgi:luciferase family oxidoreductase group 1